MKISITLQWQRLKKECAVIHLFALAALFCAMLEVQAAPADIYELPIEDLLELEVVSATKFPQKKSEVPSAVTVITAKDIKDYGYRTLGDILNSVRGIYITSDRNYSYVGARGFNANSNNKLLLLLDGYRVNDNIYDYFSVDNYFLLDVDLIDRVEYIPGAGSSMYGSNAFFGVINVISKSGKDFKGHGVELSGRFGSFKTDQERVTFGKRFDNGIDVLLSGTHFDSGGQDLFYPEFNTPATNNGIARNSDYDRGDRLFGKLTYGPFTLEAAISNRIKGIPTAPYGTVFNDPRNHTQDQDAFVDIKYYDAITDKLHINAHAFYGYYDYDGTYMIRSEDFPKPIANIDVSRGGRWGGEVRLQTTYIERNKLLAGVDYQNNYLQNQDNFDQYPYYDYGKLKDSTYRLGSFVQDEIKIFDNLLLNLGARYDYYSFYGDSANPRIALIYQPRGDLTLKLLYGTAFRAPSELERWFDPSNRANLKAETIESEEFIIEYQLSRQWRLLASAFHYHINDPIQYFTDPANDIYRYQNMEKNYAWGAEFEAEHQWDNGTRLRASYSWVNAMDHKGNILVNSPVSLAKLNFSVPLFDNWLRAGIDAQYTSSRRTLGYGHSPGYPLLNLTLTTGEAFNKTALQGLEISGSLYNLLDQPYASVAGEEHVMREIPMDGRSFRILFNYRF